MTSSLFRLSDIRFSWPGGAPVLNGASFAIHPGERLAVEGANGAGKTTLLQIMVGFLSPASGTVWAFGAERKSESDFRPVRARTGYLFQDSDDQLFCPTVAEDIAFGPLNLGKSPNEARAVVRRVLASLHMEHLEECVTHKLSGGEKRLVSLATVLAMDPKILLLDEPTGALDRLAQERLIVILQNLPQAMLIVSHDDAFLTRLAQRRLILEDGKLTQSFP
ncbi:energy-coupling factor ABC transporter ATP-binding protein [Alphaproteobacteria bacterium]|nr:energy-coupling factor ABC transporter ATP-binding protein [Alphaproteobacteria bacterium]